jgi:hypothetical protein
LLLAGSVVANLALAGALFLRAPAPTDSGAADSALSAHMSSGSGASDALRAALAAGDVVALEAAGIPRETARRLAANGALARATEKWRALQARLATTGRWWRNGALTPAEREEFTQAQRELSEAMTATYGVDLLSRGQVDTLAFLPPAKKQALSRIMQDYEEMMAKFGANGIQLPSDREKLKLLRAERDRDIAALLSPAELADYEMRTSSSAQTLRNRFGDAIESEDDFRKLFTLQKAFDEKNPPFSGRVTPEMAMQRTAAERQLQEDMRAALGEDKYAAIRRTADNDLRTVESLASRLNLPADTTDRVAATRASYAADSQRINSDTSLTPQQRRTQLQELANRAKADLAATLGVEAAEAYAQRSTWVSMLQGGIAYSTNPKDAPDGGFGPAGQSVFPILPAGGSGGITVARQVINLSEIRSDGGPSGNGGAFFFNASPETPVGDNVQFSVAVPAVRGRAIAVPPTGSAEVILQTSPNPAPAPKAPEPTR